MPAKRKERLARGISIGGPIAPPIKGSSAWAAAVWQAIAPPSNEIPPGWGRQEDFAKEWKLSLIHTRRMLNKAVEDGKLEKRIVVAIGKDGHPHRSPIYGLKD